MTEQATVEELAGTWALLERPESRLFRAAHTSIRIHGRNVQVAVDRVGARHLLLPHDNAPDETAVWHNRSMSLSRASLVGDDGDRHTWLLLRCKRAEVEDAFVRLCAQIVRKVSEAPRETLAEHCIAVLEEWKELFGGLGPSEQSLTGLVAELLLLLRLAAVDPTGAWQAWEGPRGGRHDFRRGTVAVEVKSTLRATGRIVTVNGLAQLSPPSSGTLHVMFNRLERVPSGSITLAGLVEQLVARGIARTELMEMLDADLSSNQRNTAFELREACLYSVGGSFPRIVQESFAGGTAPVGVSGVSYAIDLDYAKPLPIDEEGPLLNRLATV